MTLKVLLKPLFLSQMLIYTSVHKAYANQGHTFLFPRTYLKLVFRNPYALSISE